MGITLAKWERLLEKKMSIQKLEEQNDKDKEQWSRIGESIRQRSQRIYKEREELFEQIQ
jgi:5-bromo-4-chloroindolyl phosphate hydrolysis protein